MEQYIQTALGIFVSVFLFTIGYRQTIGARREREKICNEKIIETILRRIILEEYTPEKNHIKKLIEGKARDYKVKPKDLLSEDQILNSIYTRIFENDLISQEQRNANIERLGALFAINKEENKQDLEISFEYPTRKSKKFFNFFSLLLGIVSTFIGVAVVSFKQLVNTENVFNPNILITIMGSIIAIFTVYLFLRIKDNQENSEEITLLKNPYHEYVNFEKEVIIQLRKLNIETLIPNSKENGFDLIAIINKEKIAIEIKYWRYRPPFVIIKQTVAKLKSAMDKEGFKKGFLIINENFGINNKLRFENNINILSLNELKSLIKKNNI